MSSLVGNVAVGVSMGAGTILSPLVTYIGSTINPQPATPSLPATGAPVTVNIAPYKGLVGTLFGVAYAADGTTPLMAMIDLPSLAYRLTLWGPFIQLSAT